MRTRLAAIVLACLIALCALLGAQSSVPNLAGHYTITGEGQQGPYSGTAQIAQKDRAVFIQWQSEGGEALQGFGVITEGYVAAGYPVGEGQFGVAVLYKIEKDALVGAYPMPDGSVYAETLAKGAGKRSRAN